MRTIPGCKFVPLALLVAALSGCGLLGVEMTSSPEVVRRGDPVTFDIKLTNFSQCPLESSAAALVAFIPLREFDNLVVDSELEGELPPELEEFLAEFRRFFDVLCTGGLPELPELPPLATSCRRDDGELVCEASGPAPAHDGSGGDRTFATAGDRLRCEMSEATMRCQLRIRLPQAAAEGGTTAVAVQPLSCITGQQITLGIDTDALCFLGTFPDDLVGLGPNQMATGQVTVAARGAGVVRNIVIALGSDQDDAGVCKGGAEAGQACDTNSGSGCPGSTCGEGICVDGDNPGLGCDVSMQAMDCPNGGTCIECADVPDTGFLPLDCTTTRIAPEAAPAMSPWGLMALSAILLAAGTLWLRRRARS